MDQDAKDFLLTRLFARRDDSRALDLDKARFEYRKDCDANHLCRICGTCTNCNYGIKDPNKACGSCSQLVDFGLASPDGLCIIDAEFEEVLLQGDEKWNKAHSYVMQLPVLTFDELRTLPWGSKVHLVSGWDHLPGAGRHASWSLFRRHGIFSKDCDDYSHGAIYEKDFPLSSKKKPSPVGRRAAVRATKRGNPPVVSGLLVDPLESTTDDKLEELAVNGATPGERAAALKKLLKRRDRK